MRILTNLQLELLREAVPGPPMLDEKYLPDEGEAIDLLRSLGLLRSPRNAHGEWYVTTERGRAELSLQLAVRGRVGEAT
jgi:hypothetical protein